MTELSGRIWAPSLLLVALCWMAAAPAGGGELAGHKLLVTSVRTGDTEVFVVDPETGDAINLTRSPKSEDRYPCWSPDGRRVAFISDRAGGANLFVMDADGGNVKQLTRTTAVCYMPSWAGDRIVLGMHGQRPEMASLRKDGSDLQMLGEGHDPCLSADGRRIVYTGHTPGGVTVFVMNADGSGKRQLVKQSNPWARSSRVGRRTASRSSILSRPESRWNCSFSMPMDRTRDN